MAESDVAIVGGGPAGLAAARYVLHAQLQATIIAPALGGWVGNRFTLRGQEPVDSVWGGGLVHEFEQRVRERPGATYVQQEASRITRQPEGTFRITLADGSEIAARTVIVATGARPKRLYVAGEREFWGRGVSFSAISHAPLFKDRDVAVVGSGDRALIATLELAALARQVYLIVAQPQELAELPLAAKVMARPNVSLFRDWEVQEVLGDEFVTGISLVGSNGETRQVAVEGVFVQFPLLPNNELVRGLVTLDEDGHIYVNHRCETNVPGLFAAGDVTNIHAEQVLVAIGEGAKAGLSAWEYLVTLD